MDMSSEDAKSASSSMKRGFCAPLIKKQAGEEKSTTQASGKKIEAKQTFIQEKHDNGEAKTTYHTSEKKKEAKKPQTSLTDSQYEEIFNSVLQGTTSENNTSGENISKNSHNETENTPLCKGLTKEQENTPCKEQENTPCNEQENTPCNEQENTPSYYDVKVGLKRPVLEGDLIRTPPPIKRSKSQTEASPWGSHFSKQLSQASSIIKDMVESQSSLMNISAMLSPATSSGEGDYEEEGGQWSQRSCQLSQRSLGSYSSQPRAEDIKKKKAPEDQRSRLENLQRLRNVGLWVFCCRSSCQKQRYLAEVTDPQDVPEIWYCHMNPDEKYNSCLKPEQKLSAEEEADMIYNEFTAGSVVWARVQGFPWWPAMVDDDPDLEQFYWLLEDDVTVTHYHVVFFDEVEVTRAWVSLKDISSFAKNENKYKLKSARGIDYSRRLRVSREQAKSALAMNTSQRLSDYSFIARYKGPISTSAKKAKDTMTKYKLKMTPKIVNKEEFKTQTPKKDIEKKVNVPRTKDVKRDNKTKSEKKAEVGLKTKNIKRSNKKQDEEKTGNGPKKPVVNLEEKQSSMKISRLKKSKEENIAKEFEEVEDQLLDKPVVKNKKLKAPMFENDTVKKTQMSEKIDVKQASKASLKNSGHIETSNLEEESKRSINEQIVSNEPIDEMIEKNASSDQPEDNTNMDTENNLKTGHQNEQPIEKEPLTENSIMMVEGGEDPQVEDSVMKFDGDKEPEVNDSVMKLNGEKKPQVEDSVTMLGEEKVHQLEDSIMMFDSETPSHIDENSQKSKLSDKALKLSEIEDTLDSMIEPSENLVIDPPNSQVRSPENYSQSTIANYLAYESEDAVVPYAFDLSQPFEE